LRPANAYLAACPVHGGFVRSHELRRIGQARQSHLFEARTPKIEPRPTMAVGEGVNVGRQLQTRSHSFTSAFGS
jgi:hypothetical protein